ncbi:MAG: class I mannose-6-phosphate isomerase [Chthoniobacterales bacterium]|nr:class I mannose-6-phosphate isomerase [Chthoniobacterales bacterium]
MPPSPESLSRPLRFQPLFMERIWGGRRLATLYGKSLPPNVPIGESWEIVDRPEAQSVVADGPWRGRTLHDLWQHERLSVFGEVTDAPRFPLLLKLLDAREKLSLQVHPPAEIAHKLGGEPKTEFWYIADTTPSAELFVGLKKTSGRAELDQALANGTAEEHVHRIPVRAGDAMFLPSGRMHAIGAGNVIVEIQQNSDTTYRVFDWNRLDAEGKPRQLHIAESMRAIDFEDHEPGLITPAGESLLRDPLFNIDKWTLTTARAAAAPGSFAILACLAGELSCAGIRIKPGGFLLLPACLEDRGVHPVAAGTTLLRITIGG